MKYFKYVDISLDRKGLYTPSHTIYVPALYNKAVVYDEANTAIKTPNNTFNFGYIDIIDPTVEADVNALLSLGGMHGIKEITVTEAKAMLTANGYIDDGTGTFTIVPAGVDDITGEPTEAVTLTIN